MARAAEAEALYDARFVRMWRWYLMGCEMNFRHHRQVVFQVQLARSRGAVPITRGYLYDAPSEARLEAVAQKGRVALPA